MSFKDFYRNGENYFKSQYWTTSSRNSVYFIINKLICKMRIVKKPKGIQPYRSLHEIVLFLYVLPFQRGPAFIEMTRVYNITNLCDRWA